MNFPADLKYTNDHEWLRVEGTTGTIGVTDHAQSELGDVVFIDISEDLSTVKQGESFGTIEAVKTVADVNAPVSGKVIEVNRALNANPETLNADPYGEGWILRIEITDPSEIDALMDLNAYLEIVGH